MNFKEKFNLNHRKTEFNRIHTKYPDKIPLIIFRKHKCKNINEIEKNKYLIPNQLTVGQLIYVIRKGIKLNPEKSILLYFGNNSLVPTSELLSKVYEEFKDEDGFLYCYYTGENTYG